MSGIGFKAGVPEDDKAPLIGTMSNTVTEEGFAADARQLNPEIPGSFAEKIKLDKVWNLIKTVNHTVAEHTEVINFGDCTDIRIVCEITGTKNSIFKNEFPKDIVTSVLKSFSIGGAFIGSTYGSNCMIDISLTSLHFMANSCVVDSANKASTYYIYTR